MFEPGQQFARFKIVRKLGEGGMGEVYLAEDQKLGRQVALKILLPEFFDDSDRLQRFVREAKTAAKISHANVMAIYDMDTAYDEKAGRDLSFIVMENITGHTLTEYLRIRTPGTNELLRLTERIAAGLAAAHKLNIVHRDIKTDNIKIDENGDIKILDFGLAKPLDAVFGQQDTDITNTVSNELTQEGKILGTVSYMSPEQARGGPIDTRSDVFSFGVLVYRMFTGQAAFEATDKVSILAKILEGRHVPLRQKNESIPAELERIVDKCLQKDPNDRYQDTRDLVVDLRSLRRQYDSGISDSESIISNKPATKAPRSWLTFTWPKALLAVAAMFALVLCVIAVAIFSTNDGPSNPEKALALVENLGIDINKILDGAGVLGKDGSIRIPGLPKLPVQTNALAILDFDNKTGNSELDWLQAGLPEILLTDLAQSGAMNIIGRSRVLDCLQDQMKDSNQVHSHQECVIAARSMGASTVLSGTFYKMGDKIRIDARLEDVSTGRIILAEKVVGEDPFELVDSLTRKIALSLDMHEVGSSDRKVADIMSSSPEAFREYIMGMEEFRVGRYDEANVYFEKAIEIDSTFALPHMRIGMGYALQGRTQQATQYFALAEEYENKLPVRERSLLDIYKDIWFNQQFDDGMIKIRAYVANYPDDKEVRSFYAILLYELKKDKPGALAQLDTVMALDSRYAMALDWLMQIHRTEEEYSRAIEYGLLMKRYYPQSPKPYQNLMTLYHQQSLHKETIEVAHELLDKFPKNGAPLSTLASAFILQRKFDSAAYYVEEMRKRHGDEPYFMISYHLHRSKLDFWAGRFKSGIDELFETADIANDLGDSSQIFSAYSRIASRYRYLDMPDSSIHYTIKAYQWATLFQSFDYHYNSVKHDLSSASRIRPDFDKTLRDFRSRLPEELWGLADEIQKSFDALCASDTAASIDAHKAMIEKYDQSSSDNRETIGRLLILTGHYEEGKSYLQQVAKGRYETTQARYYLRSRYYIGVAEEALGNSDAAVKAYREVLEYWGDADIQIDLITDARERLAKLTS